MSLDDRLSCHVLLLVSVDTRGIQHVVAVTVAYPNPNVGDCNEEKHAFSTTAHIKIEQEVLYTLTVASSYKNSNVFQSAGTCHGLSNNAFN